MCCIIMIMVLQLDVYLYNNIKDKNTLQNTNSFLYFILKWNKTIILYFYCLTPSDALVYLHDAMHNVSWSHLGYHMVWS